MNRILKMMIVTCSLLMGFVISAQEAVEPLTLSDEYVGLTVLSIPTKDSLGKIQRSDGKIYDVARDAKVFSAGKSSTFDLLKQATEKNKQEAGGLLIDAKTEQVIEIFF